MVAACGGTGSDDGRSERRGLRRIAASWSSGELRWGVWVRELVLRWSIGRSQFEPLLRVLELGLLGCRVYTATIKILK
uniref:Uncharacterized protein n=1 Tax=Physcomitrium patens TaxID=3218 RepID=A0A2K1IWR6_PHYPA|nr:hypothetical protein PHYPA_023535 [Physcomitrium patens]